MSLFKRFATVLFGKVLPKRAYPVVRGPLRGKWFILGAGAGDAGGVSIHFGLAEPQQTQAFVNSVGPNQVVFDIGANVGYYSLLASKLVGTAGTVVAFEPDVRNLSYLHRHVTLNKAYNVQVLPFACSDSLGLCEFQTGDNCDGAIGFAGPPERLARLGRRLQLVSTLTVDAIVQRLQLEPDVMKIDVEGAESAVLRGAQETLRDAMPKILLSVHGDEQRTACVEYLRAAGYVLVPLDKTEPKSASEFLASRKP